VNGDLRAGAPPIDTEGLDLDDALSTGSVFGSWTRCGCCDMIEVKGGGADTVFAFVNVAAT
jgi:hypothetical protein